MAVAGGILSEMLQQIREMFERLVTELPPGTADVNVKPAQKGGGTVIEMVPANPEDLSGRYISALSIRSDGQGLKAPLKGS